MLKVVVVLFWISVAVVFYSYILYPVVLPVLARLFGRRVRRDAGHVPTVGVVVPVYNEREVIRKKIDNILAFDYPPEKLVVWIGSDCSIDDTVEIARGYDDARVHVWEASRRGGKTGIMNNMVPLVDAEIILFTDANTIHAPDSLKKLVAPFADPATGGVAGHIDHIARTSVEFEERIYRSFESRQKIFESDLHSTISAFGGFYAVRKTLFRQIPPHSYSNDDILIPMNVIRQGHRMIFEPAARSYEETTESLNIEFKRRIRIGAGNFQAFFWLLDFLNPARGWPWFCYVSHKVTRWFSPLFIVIGLIACGVLGSYHPAHGYQCLFNIAIVIVAAALASRITPMRLTNNLYYFLAMNVACVLGFFRYCRGIRSAAWERTRRSAV